MSQIISARVSDRQCTCLRSLEDSPVDAVQAVPEGHQQPLPQGQLQVLRLRDDQHVGAGQVGAEVVQVDPAVVRQQADVRASVLPGGQTDL